MCNNEGEKLNWSDFNTVDYCLMGALALLFVVQVCIYAICLAAPARAIRGKKKHLHIDAPSTDELPGVSVVLCAHNESENLANYLQSLLTQDYPTYEVIVVDDGSEDDTREIVERYMLHDERLHQTFVPYGARVGSTKKLALTLAAKAAKYDFLLLTDADCVAESNLWIRAMMQGFASDKDIVLGFSPYLVEPGHVNRLVRYDTLFNGLHYLGAALCGHPYMGVGRNLAYRKSLFFESGGFTHLMTNNAGDDDLFVNHVATKTNTAVVLQRESLMWSVPKRTIQEWWQQKRRHLSVSPAYKLSTKIRLTMEPLTRGLFYALVLFIVISYQWSVVSLAALGLFLLRWMLQTAILNVSARRMGWKRFCMASVLWFDITLPLVNLWMLAVPKKNKKKW